MPEEPPFVFSFKREKISKSERKALLTGCLNPLFCLDIPSSAQASGLDGAFFSITAPL